jgi:hypothetical protein
VTFLDAEDPVLEALARVALRFDIPLPDAVEPLPPPGSDPERPPRLR